MFDYDCLILNGVSFMKILRLMAFLFFIANGAIASQNSENQVLTWQLQKEASSVAEYNKLLEKQDKSDFDRKCIENAQEACLYASLPWGLKWAAGVFVGFGKSPDKIKTVQASIDGANPVLVQKSTLNFLQDDLDTRISKAYYAQRFYHQYQVPKKMNPLLNTFIDKSKEDQQISHDFKFKYKQKYLSVIEENKEEGLLGYDKDALDVLMWSYYLTHTDRINKHRAQKLATGKLNQFEIEAYKKEGADFGKKYLKNRCNLQVQSSGSQESEQSKIDKLGIKGLLNRLT